MSRQLYAALLKKATADPVVRSGMKLANRLNLFEAIAAKPMAPRELATSLHMKDRYIWELSQAMMATGVVSMNQQGELSIPPDCVKDLLEATEKAEWEPHLFKTLPILDKCFPEGGKAGYTLDEAPFVLELVNQVRSPYTPKLVAELIQNMQLYHPDKGAIKHVLDVGCGTGDITIPLAKGLQGVSVIGCDTSEKAIVTASKSLKGVPNLSFVKVDGEAYDKAWMKKFDVVLLFDVLHDLPYPDKTMTDILKVLKDDGIIVILDPDVSSDPMNNVGNMHAANALTFSSFYCVPSSCCHHHSSALGVSWGREQKERFLNEMGLTVKNRISLLGSIFFHTFVCVKTPLK
ncbi:uncharacterized protein LOC110459947 isoform X2 [Mizuhopecten yessoensis]|uniref:uncharacterized protein LOC110459947 isoform X2 n=1 Tax=Mizuhopecten yessoensis TaxID=6573 RepID=UPI000B45A365|nr:uncharacterized protein LOC110459947 isoform X2 [Mizuhopecten yessoensis]XP_021368153.1 uncharacterized protein LOC110459947 isoform X2 [Mizuhopecten yessoensis]